VLAAVRLSLKSSWSKNLNDPNPGAETRGVPVVAYCEYCYLYTLRPDAVRCEECSQVTALRPAGYSKAGSSN